MSDALTLDALTAERLTEILRRKGHVAGSRIERIAIESSRTTLISAIARLRLEWSLDADEPVPSRLFLKMSRPDHNAKLAAGVLKEVTFYDTVVALMPPGIDGRALVSGAPSACRGALAASVLRGAREQRCDTL